MTPRFLALAVWCAFVAGLIDALAARAGLAAPVAGGLCAAGVLGVGTGLTLATALLGWSLSLAGLRPRTVLVGAALLLLGAGAAALAWYLLHRTRAPVELRALSQGLAVAAAAFVLLLIACIGAVSAVGSSANWRGHRWSRPIVVALLLALAVSVMSVWAAHGPFFRAALDLTRCGRATSSVAQTLGLR